ncbi:hypothetical protein LCGC14_2038180 [marine sediment metagenome]|uniref:Uncharacterized protein n=1 Tax=marine sediment metagenome TaxID=412755 RepID=A0A0F9FFA6_9ZZZZ
MAKKVSAGVTKSTGTESKMAMKKKKKTFAERAADIASGRRKPLRQRQGHK